MSGPLRRYGPATLFCAWAAFALYHYLRQFEPLIRGMLRKLGAGA